MTTNERIKNYLDSVYYDEREERCLREDYGVSYQIHDGLDEINHVTWLLQDALDELNKGEEKKTLTEGR